MEPIEHGLSLDNMKRVIRQEIEKIDQYDDGWDKRHRVNKVTMDLLKYILILEMTDDI